MACMSKIQLNFEEIYVLGNLPNVTPILSHKVMNLLNLTHISAKIWVLSTPIHGPKRVLLFGWIHVSILGSSYFWQMGSIQIDPDWPNESFDKDGPCWTNISDVH